jgi:ATP/maltotriose-dependent transcriptional regulator MalT
MVTTLAATKIRVPHLRDCLVSRLDLTKRLETGLVCPLTLISAPAGYGKTTLLAEVATRIPITWLSLDNEDNDPIRFWSNFISALQTRNQRIGTSAFQMLSASQPPTLHAIIVQLINEISAEGTLLHAYILVLDDYHLIQSREIHQDVAFLLEHLPEQLRLVIATRVDPPLPLARMRASGQISEFRAQDLRFTLSETENLLNSIIGLSLSKDKLTALDVRTEGWVAGLQMAAISMQRQTDLPGFIAAFTGSHRHILDYLTEEVLNQQTEETCQFLLETSFLQHLNAQLCDAVTGCQNGFAMLEQLETANLFLVPIDEERKWYRYHNLFASFLFGRLRRLKPEYINALYQRAATWFGQNGYTDEAVSYALTAGDFDLAAEIIGSAAPVYIVRLEYRTVLNWLCKLPVEIILKHFRLAVFYGFIYAKLGHIEQAETWLKRIEGKPLVIPTSSMASITLAHIAIAHQNDSKATELLKGVIEDEGGLPTGSPLALRNQALKLFASFLLSQIQKAQGRLYLASQTCLSALSTSGYVLPENPFSVLLGWLHILLAELLYEQNKLDDAMQHANAGVEIAVQKLEKNLQGYGLTVVEMIRRSQVNNLLEKRAQSSSVTIDGFDLMSFYQLFSLSNHDLASPLENAVCRERP